MRNLKNLFFLLFCLYLFFINYQLFFQNYSKKSYLFILDAGIVLIIFVDMFFISQITNKLQIISRENEKLKLSLSDYQLESTLLSTLIEIIDTFEEEVNLEESLHKIADALKNVFKNGTVVIQLFGMSFVRVIKGREIRIPLEMLEEVVLKGHPVLINNTSSFPQYKTFSDQNVKSFIISPLHKKNVLIGVLCVFSFEETQFTLKELNLLKMVTTPAALLIENVELFEKTKILSITDGLTQIYNRRHFEKVLGEVIQNAKEKNESVSFCICDIDYFKHYNDSNGHPAGDKVLKEIADMLRKGVKGSDIVARYGGEEFVIIFPNTPKEIAFKLCEALRKTIDEHKFPYEEKQPNGNLTLSFGIAHFPTDADSVETLIKKADEALYKAKAMGKDMVVMA